MDPVWLAIAFVFGFVVKQVGLPPLVGFLAAGFVLHGFGVQTTEALQAIADYGVMLLLFIIGLKLRLKTLARPQVWASATAHMGITVLAFGLAVFALSWSGVSLFSGLDLRTSLLVAFALSFSSTVFAVKVLEEKGEMDALHGRVAIGILIVQDIYAVLFLTVSTGRVPSAWAIALLGLVVLRPLLLVVMERLGHGELLVLAGLLLPVAGGGLFDAVGLKPDLGALMFGVLLAGHPKADEMAKVLFSFKDVFLIGFFLTIGLLGAPSAALLAVAGGLALAIPIKTGLFYFLLARMKLRARTSALVSFTLSNYSEFGLIVGYVGVTNGWIGSDWLVVFALALAITFVVASPLNKNAHAVYARWRPWLQQFETVARLPDDDYLSVKDAEIVVFGLGRVGTGAYDTLRDRFGRSVWGVDVDEEVVARHRAAGRDVVQGDATDSDFWERVRLSTTIRLALLTMSDVTANVYVATQVSKRSPTIDLAAAARYEDDVEVLKAAGVDEVYDFYSEAGVGLAEHVHDRMMLGVPSVNQQQGIEQD